MKPVEVLIKNFTKKRQYLILKMLQFNFNVIRSKMSAWPKIRSLTLGCKNLEGKKLRPTDYRKHRTAATDTIRYWKVVFGFLRVFAIFPL